MANPEHLAILKKGVTEWNRWRDATAHGRVDLSGADLAGLDLSQASLLGADLQGTDLTRTQFEYAHLKKADLTGAKLDRTNFEHANAREAIFDQVVGTEPNFAVSTLRDARFRQARLRKARFHRAYLRETDLSGAVLQECWLRFANLEGACCQNADFSGSDLSYAALVDIDLRGANLTGVQVFGISAWEIQTDAATRQDLVVGRVKPGESSPLRAHDLDTAQLLSLLLDSAGVRAVINSVTSKLVLILGSFSPAEKPVLDALRERLQSDGYVAVEFDFERPSERDYAQTILTLAGLSRFVVADLTNAKEVRSELLEVRQSFRQVPAIPIARADVDLPATTMNWFTRDELQQLLVRYRDVEDLLRQVGEKVIQPAEERASRIAEDLEKVKELLRGKPSP